MSSNSREQPIVLVIGGPNGAGKSTIAPAIIDRMFKGMEFVNADTIARGLSELDPGRHAFAAGRIMLRHIADLGKQRQDFAFETTLASRTFVPFLRRLIADGYVMHLVYIWVRSPRIALKRVASRVASGGHGVPKETVERRFFRSIHNLFELYMPLADSWEVFDNSTLGIPSTIAIRKRYEYMIVQDQMVWRQLERLRHEK